MPETLPIVVRDKRGRRTGEIRDTRIIRDLGPVAITAAIGGEKRYVLTHKATTGSIGCANSVRDLLWLWGRVKGATDWSKLTIKQAKTDKKLIEKIMSAKHEQLIRSITKQVIAV